MYKFPIKRIKKRVNDYILFNYHEIFKDVKETAVVDENGDVQMDSMQQIVTQEDVLNNPRLLKKTIEEISLSD